MMEINTICNLIISTSFIQIVLNTALLYFMYKIYKAIKEA